MAIDTEFIDFIIPIDTIREKYPGGWEQCLQDHQDLVGGRVWYDDYLLRDGAMNPGDIGLLVEKWMALGFTSFKEKNGENVWTDFCVYEGMFGGLTLACQWLVSAGP